MTPSPSLTVTIEVTDANEFNLGWLIYVLGQDRPGEDRPEARSGWDMGEQTGGMLKNVRNVFARQPMLDRPQYIVTVPVTVNDQNVVITNVGPDQQGTAKEIAKGHAKDVAGV
jgi:hypothetical protein